MRIQVLHAAPWLAMSEIRNKELQYCKGTQKLRERNIAVYINHRINRRETLCQ